MRKPVAHGRFSHILPRAAISCASQRSGNRSVCEPVEMNSTNPPVQSRQGGICLVPNEPIPNVGGKMKICGARAAIAVVLGVLLSLAPCVLAQRQMEKLGRGVVAVKKPDGSVFVS